jgi:hypothetical protein
MKTLKNILKYVLGITSVLFLASVIMGFYYTWKTGIIWTVGVLFLFTLFLTFTDNYKFNPENRIKRNLIRVLLYVLFIASFTWGNRILNENTEYKNYLLTQKNKSNPEEKINEEKQTKEDIKTVTPSIDKTKLIEFQKKWSDSVVKSWEGSFIINSKLSTTDTIYFELSKNATKAFNSNREQTLPMYVSSYEKSLNNKFGTLYNSVKTVIDFLPNKELLKNNNPNDWTHPIIKNRGLKIFGGNEYSKDYIGKLSCKYKDESNGNTYFIITKDNGNETRIVDYEFDNYWIKTTDPNYNSANGISKCY